MFGGLTCYYWWSCRESNPAENECDLQLHRIRRVLTT